MTNIVEHQIPSTAIGEEFHTRRPIIYDKASDTLHVGPFGSFHEDLAKAAELRHRNYASTHGWIGGRNYEVDNYDDVKGTYVTPDFGWYGKGPQDPKLDALIQNKYKADKAPLWSFSRYLGVSTPPGELTQQIAGLGWQVAKVQWSSGKRAYEAKAKNPHGEQKVGYGPDPASALSQLLLSISRHELIRSSSIDRSKFGLYTSKLKEIAQAYLKAPVYDPKIAGYFLELGQDSTNRAKAIREQIDVKIVDGPEPYDSAQDMFDDIRKGKLKVSRANAGHPIWTHTQVVNFRIVHDVMGHYESGGDFSWAGENLASRAHARLLSSTAQIALFTECIGQAAYTTYHRNFGPQKIAALPEFFDPLGEGKTQRAVHPSQMFVKGPMPGEKRPDSASVTARLSSSFQDPNYGYQSGIAPQSLASGGLGSAYLDHGDPLEAQKVMDTARLVDTGWHSLKKADGTFDRERAKLAIVNAFRVVLLSPRKDLRWNAIHYQDIAHIPAHVEDPKVYWDTLESRRRSWNQAQGIDPHAHMSYYKLIRPLQGALLQLHPEIGFDNIVEETQRVIHNWRQEEFQRIESEDAQKAPDKQKSADEIERRANDALTKRIEKFLKDKRDRKTDIDDRSDQQSLFASGPRSGLSYLDKIHQKFEDARPMDPIRQKYGEEIRRYLDPNDLPDDHLKELLGLYGYLAMKWTDEVDNEMVHDAWSYWTAVYRKNPDHKSLKPFDELSPEVQEMDSVYREAINRVAKEKFDKTGANSYTWNPEPDTFKLNQAQMVPVSELEKFKEYDRRPGGENAINTSEYWESLKNHIKEHGFTDPLYVDYDQNKGIGHLSEGHHRLEIAKDLGITHVPVIVYPSRRTPANGGVPFSGRFSAAGNQYNMLTGETDSKYGAFMGTHLKAIAQISQYSDQILDAALRDVYEHDGAGHHFRATVLGLNVPGVGPKVCSFAWLLLQPMTSQLATIDTHMMDVLGHNYEKDMNRRDYFKFERELQAGRDAAGYSHVPLGAFQWGMWDHKRTGPGTHQDHSAMRVLDPVPHQHIDWNAKADNLKGEDWLQQAPDWWQNTQGARDKIAHDWDKTVGSNWPQGSIPFQVTSSKKSDDPEDELCAALDVPRDFKKKLPALVEDLKKSIDFTEVQDPDEYHITLAYAPEGYSDREYHSIVHNAPGNIPFENPRLDSLEGKPGGDFPIVIRFDSKPGNEVAQDIMKAFEDLGADVSRFPGGWKPHITIGYSGKHLPKELKGKKLDGLTFQSREPRLLVPRGIRRQAANLTPPTPGAPWITDTGGDRLHGDPRDSIMEHALKSLAVYSPQDVWESKHEGGRVR